MMRALKLILTGLTVAGFVVMAGAYQLGFDTWPPEALLSDGSSAPFAAADVETCFEKHLLAVFNDHDAAAYWQRCRQDLLAAQALDAFERRSEAVIGGGITFLVALFVLGLVHQVGRPKSKVLRGTRLLAGAAGLRAFARRSRRECKRLGRGVELVPGVPISRERETRHFLILGSVGGGKTQTMLNLISEAIARDDGVLVLDTKGDMMAGLPALPEPLLVAPHDRRSLVWDIAADCCIKQDARELAARFIPPSSDPMWSQAAQEIFVACIVHLQATQGHRWGWADLEAVVTADVEVLAEHARNHNPNASRLLNQPDSKTTLSILTTFQTHMRIVSVLAEAWPDPRAGRFSIRGWLHHPAPRRPLILQHDPGYPELSRIWIGSMLGLLASAVGSPSLSESGQRRIWLFLDEFPQLPPIRQFPTFLELGRSKGVAVVIGAQDIAQIRAAYGPDQAKSWFGMIGTKIITRINASEAAEDISRVIGEQEIERRVRNTTRSGGRVSVTESHQREIRRVVTASELGSRLGPTDEGVRVLFVGLGDAVYELDLPYITLRKFREPILPAAWTWTPPPAPPKGTNGKTPPAALPSPLTQDLADQIRQTRH
ncbi:MAG: type IV secretion system DNA-binding domain-containing protein [Aliidongia sp.]